MSELKELSITDHHLGHFKTYTGKIIDLRNPSPVDINIPDIAASLSKICRFGGHSREFYSVAQHSVLVSLMAPIELRGPALLHDATEAYLGDVIKPLKEILGDVYTQLEHAFEEAIVKRFYWLYPDGVDYKAEIKKYDILALQVEDEAFNEGDCRRLRFLYKKYDMLQTDLHMGWPPFIAETIFKKHLTNLKHL